MTVNYTFDVFFEPRRLRGRKRKLDGATGASKTPNCLTGIHSSELSVG